MSSAAADRVLLVWPSGQRVYSSPILGRKLDMVMVHRHASRLRAHLAIVTQDDDIADNAADLGIPVFDSVKDSHLFLWNSRRSPRADLRPKLRPMPSLSEARHYLGRHQSFWYHKPIWRYTSGAILTITTLVIIGMLMVLTLPRAQVILNPSVQHITAQLDITADPQLAHMISGTRNIPARIVEVYVSSSGDVVTTGSVQLDTQHAQGTVIFTNLTNQRLQLPAGTAVRTTDSIPVRFVTQQDIDLKQQNSIATAKVRAFKPGPAGNVDTGLINDVEGPLGASVAVTNQTPTTDGDVLSLPAVSRADRNRLYDLVHERIRQDGHAEITANLNPHEFSPLGTARVSEVTSATFNSFIGEQTSILVLEMRAKVASTVVDETLAYEIGRRELERRSGTELKLLADTISFSRSTTSHRKSFNQVVFTLTARGTSGPDINPQEVQQSVRWQPISQAGEILYARFPIVSRPEVTLWPSWFTFMPWLSWRTEVIVDVDADTNSIGLTGANSSS